GVPGWAARQVGDLRGGPGGAVNSAAQGARATLREHLPERRLEWARSAEPTAQERAVLRRYMQAVEQADLGAVAGLLAEDVRATMPPFPMWFQGRDAVLASLAASSDPGSPAYVGRSRMVPGRGNRQPAAAAYLQRPGDRDYRPFAIGVLRIAGGRIEEITAFHEPGLFPAFALPEALPPRDR